VLCQKNKTIALSEDHKP